MTARVPAGGEFAIIDRLKHRLPGPPAGEVWIGDDAAVIEGSAGWLLLSTDMTVAGVHADLGLMGVDDLGWRAVAGAVSDIAAMGGRASHLLVAVAGPVSTDLDRLYRGVAEAAAVHGCHVVGGDLSNAGEIVVVVTVTGTVGPGPGPVLRSGAEAGDQLFLTGPVGGSAAGLRTLRAQAGSPVRESSRETPLIGAHRRPEARLAEGEAARLAGASAMIDVSDGLAADLGHLVEASGVGYSLDRVPVAPGATVEEALGGGEDYELVFAAADGQRVKRGFDQAGLTPPLAIGICTADRAQRQWAGVTVATAGWEHRWA
ncbi:MAG TPA: thiamine-phosphate kinase [Acidimicrobiales bacterium]